MIDGRTKGKRGVEEKTEEIEMWKNEKKEGGEGNERTGE